MQTHWRLALMFDAPGHDLGALEAALRQAGNAIRSAALGHHVRFGIMDRHPDLGSYQAQVNKADLATVDGAIEVTIANEHKDEIPEICRKLRGVIEGFVDLASVHVMAGPTYYMVPVRGGDTFLSLAFRRVPEITSDQFKTWWHDHHSKTAIPVLGDGLLAYDQVHVEQTASQAAAAAFGADYVEYDAYDNLTWADRYGFMHSISDEVAMGPVYADEIGRIDPVGRRSSIMIEVR